MLMPGAGVVAMGGPEPAPTGLEDDVTNCEGHVVTDKWSVSE